MNNKLRLQTCFCNKAFKMALRPSIINSGKGGDSSVLGTNDFAQFLYKIFIISNFCKEVIRFCFTFQVQKYVLLTNNIFLLLITMIRIYQLSEMAKERILTKAPANVSLSRLRKKHLSL